MALNVSGVAASMEKLVIECGARLKYSSRTDFFNKVALVVTLIVILSAYRSKSSVSITSNNKKSIFPSLIERLRDPLNVNLRQIGHEVFDLLQNLK